MTSRLCVLPAEPQVVVVANVVHRLCVLPESNMYVSHARRQMKQLTANSSMIFD